ncbi:acyl-CoA N-acyltransferase [Xylariaceae sp. FL1019]|nr:acyl-CoA N-acyltransferase [Xylariaceae sp. FL1019]
MMETTSVLANNWRSERLVYHPPENDEQTKNFIHTNISSDAVGLALSEIRVIRPKAMMHSEEIIAILNKAELGVLIYLPSEDAKPTPIGFIGVGWGGRSASTAQNRTTSISIALAPPYQNQGYGGEAINWALDWAFRLGGYHRVEIGTVSYNKRAMHLYQRLGFVEEGRQRESLYFDRQWHDRMTYGMLESEWAALRGME